MTENPVAAQIDAETERMNRAIEALEVKLARTFNVTACVPFPMMPGKHLHFGKVEGKWGLSVETDGVPDATPLRQTARGTRVAAAALVPELLGALEEETQKVLVDVSGAADVYEGIAAAWRDEL